MAAARVLDSLEMVVVKPERPVQYRTLQSSCWTAVALDDIGHSLGINVDVYLRLPYASLHQHKRSAYPRSDLRHLACSTCSSVPFYNNWNIASTVRKSEAAFAYYSNRMTPWHWTSSSHLFVGKRRAKVTPANWCNFRFVDGLQILNTTRSIQHLTSSH